MLNNPVCKSMLVTSFLLTQCLVITSEADDFHLLKRGSAGTRPKSPSYYPVHTNSGGDGGGKCNQTCGIIIGSVIGGILSLIGFYFIATRCCRFNFNSILAFFRTRSHNTPEPAQQSVEYPEPV